MKKLLIGTAALALALGMTPALAQDAGAGAGTGTGTGTGASAGADAGAGTATGGADGDADGAADADAAATTDAGDTTAQGDNEQMAPSIDVGSVMMEDGKITGVKVTSPVKGYVVVHDNGAGAPPASLGNAAVDAGETSDLSIDLTGQPGEGVSLMLHEETNDNDTYDFGPGSTDVDTPVTTSAGPVVTPINQ